MTFKEKIDKSLLIIEGTFERYSKDEIAIAWTGGKDSTLVLHLVRNFFKGKVPVKVFFNDSGFEFDEVQDFIDKISKKWQIKLVRIKHPYEDRKNLENKSAFFAKRLKIKAIKKGVSEYGIRVFITGIRWDEHDARGYEKYLSKRRDHVRINPILHFSEEDVWNYIRKFKVPFVTLYKSGYRSLGEKPFTKPVERNAKERDGRNDGGSENVMLMLRQLGYW